MTFPAEHAFRRDRTLTPAARRVYEYLTTELDFCEVRAVKSGAHADHCGIGKPHFIDGLNALVARGYLIEHARDTRLVRHFTLAWSLDRTRQHAG